MEKHRCLFAVRRTDPYLICMCVLSTHIGIASSDELEPRVIRNNISLAVFSLTNLVTVVTFKLASTDRAPW